MRAREGKWARGAVATASAVAALLFAAPAAQAAFGLTNAAATPDSTAAGANTDVTLSFDVVEPSHDLRDLTVHLPPGLVGNPLAAPMCTEAQLNADACDPLSDVGDVSNEITATVLGFLPVPLTVNGNVYNVVPRAGEPARFGIVLNPTPLPIPGNPLLPKIILQSAASLRPSDLGLDTVLNNLPNTATVLGLPTAIDVESLSLTLSGTAPTGQGFIRLPTSCKTHTVGFDAVAHDSQTASAQATFTTDSCGALPFSPELSARIKRVGAVNVPVELSTTIAQTIEEAGLLRAQVVLPAGIGGNNEVLNNQCSQAAFAAGACPDAAIVGSAVAASPLQSQSLSGPVALVEPAAPGLPDLGIDLRGPLALKLKGTLGFTPEGRNIVVFDNLPDIPISEFTLTFAGGPGGLVAASRDVCEPPPLVFDANFLAHSGTSLAATATPTVECSGVPGGGDGNKRPRARIRLKRLGSGEPAMRMLVKGRDEKLRKVTVKLPKQLALAAGKRFDRGVETDAGVKSGHSRRVLKLRAKNAMAGLGARLRDGALVADDGLRESARLRFKLKVREADGDTARLTVRSK